MYLVKEIVWNKLDDTYKVVNGLHCYKINGMYEEIDQFFGKSIITESFNTKNNYEKDDDKFIIPYVTSYEVSDLSDGYKQINYFIKSEYIKPRNTRDEACRWIVAKFIYKVKISFEKNCNFFLQVL